MPVHSASPPRHSGFAEGRDLSPQGKAGTTIKDFMRRVIPRGSWVFVRQLLKARRRLAGRFSGPRIMAGDGFRIWIHPRDNFTERQFWETRHFPEEASMRLLARLLAGKKALFLDIGANVGVFTLAVNHVMAAESRTLAFEPNPLMLARLKANLALNDSTGVEVFGCALGAENGRARLSFPAKKRTNHGAASLHRHRNETRSIEVEMRRLADCLPADWRDYDLVALKIDVEGYEDQVLQPFFASVDPRLYPAVLLTETSHGNLWQIDLAGLLESRGYGIGTPVDNNCVFVRPGQVLAAV